MFKHHSLTLSFNTVISQAEHILFFKRELNRSKQKITGDKESLIKLKRNLKKKDTKDFYLKNDVSNITKKRNQGSLQP